MNKKIFIFIFIIILIIFGIFIFSNIKEPKKNEDTKKEKLTYEEKLKQMENYKEKNNNRYLEYHKKNPNLTEEEIINYVNVGIDNEFYTNTKKATNLNTDYLLVNKYYYLENNYVPDNLEDLELEYARSGMKLVKSAKEAFVELVDDAKEEGYTIRAMSSYRSYEYQKNLYNQYLARDGEKAADTYSARPGYSEHQTGLCVDIDNEEVYYTNFETTKEFEWMQENAYKYGFILRFPKDKEHITGYQYESWHYRYVGKKIAKYIKDNDITFEEYYTKMIEK